MVYAVSVLRDGYDEDGQLCVLGVDDSYGADNYFQQYVGADFQGMEGLQPKDAQCHHGGHTRCDAVDCVYWNRQLSRLTWEISRV